MGYFEEAHKCFSANAKDYAKLKIDPKGIISEDAQEKMNLYAGLVYLAEGLNKLQDDLDKIKKNLNC